jgi:MerR family copper efflux transcriptional regulator
MLQIGQLAERVGVSAKTIRYYGQVGLLPEPVRSESGYRLYGIEDEERLRFISTARRTGFSLGEIKEILALRDRGIAPCDYVRETIRRRLGEVDRQLAELNQLKRELGRLEAVARSLPGQPETPAGFCHILEAPAGSSK